MAENPKLPRNLTLEVVTPEGLLLREEVEGMARTKITVEDDAEILVHWRAGRGIRSDRR